MFSQVERTEVHSQCLIATCRDVNRLLSNKKTLDLKLLCPDPEFFLCLHLRRGFLNLWFSLLAFPFFSFFGLCVFVFGFLLFLGCHFLLELAKAFKGYLEGAVFFVVVKEFEAALLVLV